MPLPHKLSRLAKAESTARGRRSHRVLAAIGAFSLAVGLSLPQAVSAQVSNDVVKIGVLTDMEGNFAEATGPGSVLAARMAVADFGGTVLGKRIEVVFADHQNKPDVASTVAREWYDAAGVDLIVDAVGSPIALAVQELARQRKKMLIVDGVSTLKFTNELCSETGIMWIFTSYSNSKALGQGAVDSGAKNWYFLTLDTAGGQAIVSSLMPFMEKAGGKVVGNSKFPLNATDFSSYLLQAQASKPDVFALATSGASIVNLIKQGQEFQTLKGGARFVAPFLYISDIHAIGIASAKGTLLTEPFYWDMNAESRSFSKRFFEQRKSMPTAVHAGVYTSIMHYLKAVKQAGTDDGPKVAAAMRAIPINDFMTKNGQIRVDGDVDRERYVFEVKKPEESKGPYDYYKVVKTFAPAETTFPLSESTCALVKK
jgi:branched-chain amino acid transport system substrate-binding protein